MKKFDELRQEMSPERRAKNEEEARHTIRELTSLTDPDLTLGQRLLVWCGRELARGVKETPPGTNRSQRIDEYFSAAPFERDGRPLRLRGVPWCAAAACAGVWACLLPDETSPIVARVSGIELERDARASGRWSPGAEQGRPGDLAILPRSGSDPKRASWERHVAVVVSDDGAELVTVGGNEGDTWRRTVRRERPLGFVRL